MNPSVDPTRLLAIDHMMLGLARARFLAVVGRAVLDLRHLKEDQLAPLTQAEDLPPAFRAAYADLGRRLEVYLAVFDNLQALELEWLSDDLKDEACISARLWASSISIPAAEIPCIQAVVERLNLASSAVRATLDQMKARLVTMPRSAIAWDNRVEVRCTVDFAPVPERPCYRLAEDPLALELQPPLTEYLLPCADEPTLSWGEIAQAGPFQGQFLSDLAHAVVNRRNALRWRLLPLIEDIWCEVFIRGDGHASHKPNDEGPPSKLPFGD